MIVPPGLSKPWRSASSIMVDADAVLHRAARIQVVGLDVHLGLAVLGHAGSGAPEGVCPISFAECCGTSWRPQFTTRARRATHLAECIAR